MSTPTYITELKTDLINHIDLQVKVLKTDLINHIDSSINDLVLTINKTVVLKEDIIDMATKQDIEELKQEISTKADKDDIDKVLSHIGDYEVRTKKLEKFVYN